MKTDTVITLAFFWQISWFDINSQTWKMIADSQYNETSGVADAPITPALVNDNQGFSWTFAITASLLEETTTTHKKEEETSTMPVAVPTTTPLPIVVPQQQDLDRNTLIIAVACTSAGLAVLLSVACVWRWCYKKRKKGGVLRTVARFSESSSSSSDFQGLQSLFRKAGGSILQHKRIS